LFASPRVVFEDDAVIAFLNQFPTQEGYTIVCPKRHVERYETDLDSDEWLRLLTVVHKVARAVAEATGAIRMYLASLGSPERNPHVHVHVCPCPAGTPFDQQQFDAMQPRGGEYLVLSDGRLDARAEQIRLALERQGRE